MTADLPEHPPPRARPVAEPSIEALLVRCEELTRRWAIALLLDRPLEKMGELPLGDLAREGPTLCSQLLRALGSDAELERLLAKSGSGGRENDAPALRLAAMAGARDASGTIAAAEALRGVLWETLLEEMPKPLTPRQATAEVGALADRLAHVFAQALAAAIAAPLPGAPAIRLGASRVVIAEADTSAHLSARAGAVGQHTAIVDELAPGGLPVTPAPSARAPSAEAPTAPRRASAGGAPSADPHSQSAPWAAAVTEAPQGPPPWADRVAPVVEAPLEWEDSSPVPPPRYASEIEIRDERGEQGPAAWIGSIGRQLARFQEDGLPFAVLLLEVLGLESILRERPQPESSRLLDQLEESIAQLRPRWGSLTRESAGRFWLLVPQTDRLEAARFAERLLRAVRSATRPGDMALEVAIGTAVCPEDGREAPALAAQADVELYAARSSIRASLE